MLRRSAFSAPALRIALVFAALFAMKGALLPYLSAWLDGRGLSSAQIGLILGLSKVIAFVATVAAGMAADVLGRRRVLTAAGVALAVVLLAHLPANDVVVLALVVSLAAAANGPTLPVLEALVLEARVRFGVSYGPARAYGSAAFIVANLLVGGLIAWFSAEAVLIYLIVTATLFLLSTFALPRDAPRLERPKAKDTASVIFQPVTLLAIAASAAVQASHAFYYAFSVLVWEEAGHSGLSIGALWAWGVLAEIAFLAWFAKRAETLGAPALFAIGAVCGLVRWTLTAFSPGLGGLFVLQTLHAGTFAIAHVGLIAYVAQHVPARAAASVQGANAAVSMGVAMAGATALSGVLRDAYGAMSYLAMSGLCVAGLVFAFALALVLRRRASGEPERARARRAERDKST